MKIWRDSQKNKQYLRITVQLTTKKAPHSYTEITVTLTSVNDHVIYHYIAGRDPTREHITLRRFTCDIFMYRLEEHVTHLVCEVGLNKKQKQYPANSLRLAKDIKPNSP